MTHGNGNGSKFQRWVHVIFSTAGFLLAVVAIIWNASGSNAQLQEKVRQLDEHLKYDDDHLERIDVIEPQLHEIEKGQEREEKSLEQQGRMLEEIRLEMMRRR